jgi:DNA-binding transcriptional LysR family regulator
MLPRCRPEGSHQEKSRVAVNGVLNPEGCAARGILRSALQKSNIDLVVGVETYNYQLQLALVAQNRGLGLVPERILSRSRLISRLRKLSVHGLNFPMSIWTVHRQLSLGLIPSSKN